MACSTAYPRRSPRLHAPRRQLPARGGPASGPPGPSPEAGLGQRLFALSLALALQADASGLDAESERRRALVRWAQAGGFAES